MSDTKELLKIYNDNVKDYGGPHLEMREADFVRAVGEWNSRASPWIKINWEKKTNIPKEGDIVDVITKRFPTRMIGFIFSKDLFINQHITYLIEDILYWMPSPRTPENEQ